MSNVAVVEGMSKQVSESKVKELSVPSISQYLLTGTLQVPLARNIKKAALVSSSHDPSRSYVNSPFSLACAVKVRYVQDMGASFASHVSAPRRVRKRLKVGHLSLDVSHTPAVLKASNRGRCS